MVNQINEKDKECRGQTSALNSQFSIAVAAAVAGVVVAAAVAGSAAVVVAVDIAAAEGDSMPAG